MGWDPGGHDITFTVWHETCLELVEQIFVREEYALKQRVLLRESIFEKRQMVDKRCKSKFAHATGDSWQPTKANIANSGLSLGSTLTVRPTYMSQVAISNTAHYPTGTQMDINGGGAGC